jgi:outer membrane protein
MKKIALSLAIVLMPFLVMAQQEIKMGYINSQEVMMLMPEVSDVEKQIADLNSKNQKYIQDMGAELQAKMEKYEKEKDGMTESIRKATEEELNGMYARIQTTQQTMQQDMQMQQMKLVEPLRTKLQAAVDAVAKKNNLYFVFDLMAEAVIYKSDKAVDITSLVKKELGILQ